ncbi:hypothetical protein FBQ96_02495 [Nitrospirales bacterium NOB]|nr:hypothetical protein [Nitrospira sp. NTP2]MDL1888446.1 hypothetical protein [Nitrospirales bacterium NOB]
MRLLLITVLFLVPLLSPFSASGQFMQGFGEGFQRTSQYNMARQQQATERERLKLQYADQWRQIRDRELRQEVEQWAVAVQAWREVMGQPALTDEQLHKRLDSLRVFDWERQYEQAWMNR